MFFFSHFVCLFDFSDISKIRILVPGAGLGRLTYELAYRGYYCEGNEFSLFMLVASNFVLNKCIVENQYTIVSIRKKKSSFTVCIETNTNNLIKQFYTCHSIRMFINMSTIYIVKIKCYQCNFRMLVQPKQNQKVDSIWWLVIFCRLELCLETFLAALRSQYKLSILLNEMCDFFALITFSLSHQFRYTIHRIIGIVLPRVSLLIAQIT